MLGLDCWLAPGESVCRNDILKKEKDPQIELRFSVSPFETTGCVCVCVYKNEMQLKNTTWNSVIVMSPPSEYCLPASHPVLDYLLKNNKKFQL